jgi:hypothetical protein
MTRLLLLALAALALALYLARRKPVEYPAWTEPEDGIQWTG